MASSLKGVNIIIAPFHAGEYLKRVGRGPHRIAETGLIDALNSAGIKDIDLVEIDSVDSFEGEIGRTFEVKRRIADAVSDAVANDHFPLVLAGNCNATVGVYAGLSADVDVVWFDAHPDFDTPDECTSGYFDGQGVATLVGQCWRRLTYTIPKFRPLSLNRLIYCGVRDFEPGQREKIEAFNVRAVYGGANHGEYYAQDLGNILDDEFRGGPAHIHIDLDVLDTSVGHANEYAAPGGLDVDQLHSCLVEVVRARQPVSMTIASFNPDGQGSIAIAETAVTMAKLVLSAAFGLPQGTSSGTNY